jgi:CheY-like chemotaxis protein
VTTAARDILAVDDSALIRHVVNVGLPAPAWHVISAESGEEALVLAAEAHFDAVLLDVVMPGLDGPATFARLRATPLTREIPVVFLTGSIEEPDRDRLRTLGAAGVIAKPFDPASLAEQLAAAVGWRS